MTTPLQLVLDPISGKLVPVTDLTSTSSRISALENKDVKTLRFHQISSGTNGTVTLAANTSVVLDSFGGTTDAIITGISEGQPTTAHVYDSNSNIVATSFDSNGNFSLTSVPSGYPCALVYWAKCSLKNLNTADSNIVNGEDIQIIPSHTELSNLNFDSNYQHLTTTQKTNIDTLSLNSADALQCGVVSWTGAATNYYEWTAGNPGTLKVTKGITGIIGTHRVTAASNQTISIARDTRPVIYFDSNGLIQQTSFTNDTVIEQNIPVFVVIHDVDGNEFVERKDYDYTCSRGLHRNVNNSKGLVLDYAPGTAKLSRYGTGTGASSTDRMVNLSASKLIDRSLIESFAATTTGILVNHTYFDGSFIAHRYSQSKEFPMIYISGGTPTVITSGKYGVFRLFAARSDLNSTNMQFLSEIDSAQYDSLDAAKAACATTAQGFTFTAPDLAQIGFVIVYNNLSGGYVAAVVGARKTDLGILGDSASATPDAANLPLDPSVFSSGIVPTNVTTVANALSLLSAGAQPYFGTDLKDPTGFVDPDGVIRSYNRTNRTITLTHASGNIEYYWRGRKTTLASPWTSSAHTADTNDWFLSSTNGTSFTWSTSVWLFSDIQVAKSVYFSGGNTAVAETHGANLPWAAHQLGHEGIKTYRKSGGAMTQVVLASTTAANRRPYFAETYVQDEDLLTINPALTTNSYTQAYLAGASPGTLTIVEGAADIVPLSGAQPYYNQNNAGTFQQTLVANNSHMNVWVAAVPMTADSDSQKHRYLFVQGQNTGTLASITALTTTSLELRSLQAKYPEFVFIHRFVIKFSSGNWTIEYENAITGTQASQVATSTSGISAVQSDSNYFSGSGTVSSPLTLTTNVGVAATLGPIIATLTEKTTLVDADKILLSDSAASNASKWVAASYLRNCTLTNVLETNATRIPYSSGTNLTSSSNLTFDTNNTLSVPTVKTTTLSAATTAGVAVAGRTDGSSVAAGNIGEPKSWTVSSVSVAQAYKSVASCSMTVGKWVITGFIGGSAGGEVSVVIGTTLDSGTGTLIGSAQGSDCRLTVCWYLDVTAAGTYYLNAYRSTGTANFGNAGVITAVRCG